MAIRLTVLCGGWKSDGMCKEGFISRVIKQTAFFLLEDEWLNELHAKTSIKYVLVLVLCIFI